ncbi:NINE protein [Marinagarivorans cellulosilyticus]|uniref:TM2 domain-containing protein n=1 Tax=Marinagarivorans cellulosilyticus TaxID=2721545 RepID=A0AAN2BKC9_9GAMM|nr:NINE protein [Marinagarivorans cellulosilyticus]BCD97894.1 hypothetical protein MARGE09_P2095 [Marinagarivorans cellulosilyticus]
MASNNSNISSTSTTEIPCISCSTILDASSSRCYKCGANLRKRPYKSRAGAAVLAILLGGVGVHRFYLGQWWGIFYVLLSWTLIPAIIAFVEAWIFLSTVQRNWDFKHNENKPRGHGDEGITWLVIAAVLGLAVIIVLTIAFKKEVVPALQQHATRAAVSTAIGESRVVQVAVETYFKERGAFPKSYRDLDIDIPQVLADGTEIGIDGEASVVIIFAWPESIKGDVLLLKPKVHGADFKWECVEYSVPKQFWPDSCLAL